MNRLTDPNHPIWDLGELFVAVIIVTVVLAHNASNFDRTETISIAQIGTLIAIVMGARTFTRWKAGKGK